MGSIQPAVETRQLASDPKRLMTYSSKLPLATRIFFHVDLLMHKKDTIKILFVLRTLRLHCLEKAVWASGVSPLA